MAMRLRKTHGGSQSLRLRHSLNGFCSAHDHAGVCDDEVPAVPQRNGDFLPPFGSRIPNPESRIPD